MKGVTKMTMEHSQPSESLSLATDSQPESQPVGEVSSFAVPQEYADKGWTEKVKTQDDLWKTTANLQEMIGKRPAGIPSNDASDADWDSFYKAAGRPDEAAYEFTDPEGLPEGFDSSSFKETASEILHSAGLSQRQAAKVYEAYIAKELSGAQGLQEQKEAHNKELDERFNALTEEHFGDSYGSAQQATNEAFDRYSPQSLKGSLTALEEHPEALAAVVATINGQNQEMEKLRKEYGAEGKITTGGQVSGSSDISTTRDQLSTLRVSKAARDPFHPEHQQTLAQIKQLSSSVDSYYKK